MAGKHALLSSRRGPFARIVTVLLVVASVPAAPLLPGVVAPIALGAEGTTTRLSVSDSEAQVFAESRGASISPDGNVVAFWSTAGDLVPGDSNSLADVFVRNPATGSTTLVSVGLGGVPANGASLGGRLSGDGRYVLFRSEATNLIAADGNGARDVFVYDRQTGVTERVSLAPDGSEFSGDSLLGEISADGRYVAFLAGVVYLRDRTLGTTRVVSVRTDGFEVAGFSPSVSDDGRYVAFVSSNPGLVTGDTNGLDDVFVRDMVANVTARVSVGPGGVQATGISKRSAISGDGRFVGFESTAANLVTGDGNGVTDMFVHDRSTGITTRVSLGPAQEEGNGASFARDYDESTRFLSSDGRYVVFRSVATNFGGPSGALYRRDTQTSTTTVISFTDLGAADTGLNGTISADGRYVAFESFAALVQEDTNNVRDVFLRDTQGTVSDFGSDELGSYTGIAISEDPVNIATGNFMHQAVDLAMPGRLVDLSFARYYNSADSRGGPLGPGWTHSYNWTITDGGATVGLRRGDGRVDRYTRNPDLTYAPPLGVYDTLVKNGDATYTLTLTTQQAFSFSSSGALTRISEPAGNQINLSYTSGNLTTITDAVGRQVTLTYVSNRLSQLQDPIGRKVTYAYDGSGRLTTVTDKIGNAAGQNPLEHQWRYAYDGGSRHLTTITDPDGQVRVTNHYDAQGRVYQQEDAKGVSTLFMYNTLQTLLTDRNGKVTTYTFDAQFRVLSETITVSGTPRTISYTYLGGDRDSVTDRNDYRTDFIYDARGNIRFKTDPQVDPETPRYVTEYEYDTRNNLFRITDARGFKTTHTFDPVTSVKLSTSEQITISPEALAVTKWEYGDPANPGMPTKIISPRGNTGSTPNYTYSQTLAYWPTGELKERIDADGNKTTFGYDGVGRQTTVVDPDGYATGGVPSQHTWTTGYDENDQVTQSVDPLGHAALTSYYANGTVQTMTDRNGNVTTYTYDSNGLLETVAQKPDPVGQPTLVYTTLVGRDNEGNVTSVQQANGVITDYIPDELGRVRVVTTHPSPTQSLPTTYVLDGNGNATSRTTADGVQTIYQYDALDRLKQVSATGLSTISYAYDPMSNRTTMIDGTGTSTYAYDGLGRLTQAVQPHGTLSYGYDLDSNRATLGYPTVGNVTYVFSPAGRMSTVTDWASRLSSYTYTAAGRAKTLALPNGMTTTYSYDEAQRLKAVTNTTASATISSHTYTLDNEGNRTAIDEYLQGITPPTQSWAASVQVNDVTTSQQDRPDIALGADGATYLIWDDFRNSGQTDIYSSRRDPATGSWSANQKANNDAGLRAQYNAAIAVDGANNAYAVWQDQREGTNNNPDTNIYFSKRSAGTGLWSANVRVNHDTSGRPSQITPEIAVRSTGDAVSVWEDHRSNQWNVYSSRLAAGGSSWGTDLRVTDNTVSRKFTPDVAVGADGTAYAVWEDDRSGNADIWFSTLPVGSSTWTANVKISDDPATFAQYDPQIGISAAGDLLVIWQDDRVPNTEVRMRRRLAGQSNWQASIVASDAAAIPVSLALSVRSDGNAFAAWQDARGSSYDIWGADYAFVTNSWSAVSLVSDDPATTAQMRPAAALTAAEVAVAWRDDRVSGGDVRARHRIAGSGIDHFALAYDGLNRLTQVTGPVSESFVLDQASNIDSRTGPTQDFSYDVANRLTGDGTLTYTWSDADQMLSKGSLGLTYDALDRVTGLTSSGVPIRVYTYNGDGLLQEARDTPSEVGLTFLWDPSIGISPVLQAFDVLSNTNDRIVYGLGPLYTVDSNDETFAFAMDGSKNVRAEVLGNGSVGNAMRYSAYGRLAQYTDYPGPSYAARLGFASQMFDEYSGLYYMRARWYDPATGRFLSRDTVPGAVRKPASLNGFVYAHGRPSLLIDPSGLEPTPSDQSRVVAPWEAALVAMAVFSRFQGWTESAVTAWFENATEAQLRGLVDEAVGEGWQWRSARGGRYALTGPRGHQILFDVPIKAHPYFYIKVSGIQVTDAATGAVQTKGNFRTFAINWRAWGGGVPWAK